MTLNESIVENATLEWFGALGYSIGHVPPARISAPISPNLSASSPNWPKIGQLPLKY